MFANLWCCAILAREPLSSQIAKLAASLEEVRLVKKESDLLVEHLRASLAVHQSEFANLKQEAKADKEILLDKIRGKDEQLEVRRAAAWRGGRA